MHCVILGWHMHQPEYRDPVTGRYTLPWVYLHALKDYTDMAWHLEQVPAACAVVNWSPVLLEQIEDLAERVPAALAGETAWPDPVLEVLAAGRPPADDTELHRWLHWGLRAHPERQMARHPRYHDLACRARAVLDGAMDASHAAEIGPDWALELLTWQHLAWLGESLLDDPRARRCMQQPANPDARAGLLELMAETFADILPRWRRLVESGQVELCVTPYAHPIVPLLIDFQTQREARPDSGLPAHSHYPDGAARARWHLDRARESMQRVFGRVPMGCWPSEGGVSTEAAQMMFDAGFDWIATGTGVLRHTLGEHFAEGHSSHYVYRLAQGPRVLFRNDHLSDEIGFVYQWREGAQAADELVGHLAGIAEYHNSDGLTLIFLDGENAWEFYPDNAREFLSSLYRQLVEHPRLRLTTPGDCLDALPERDLGHLVAGSWVYGSFDTWMGHPDKLAAWDRLCEAKRIADAAPDSPELRRQLAICEGSDWFWWPGDDNPGPAVQAFDALYRLQLGHLYRLAGHEPPPELAAPIIGPAAHGTEPLDTDGDGGAMRRSQ